MAVERDPWVVLGVHRSAPWAAVRAAYHTLARRYHADGTSPDRERMVEVNAAYADLEREHLDRARRSSTAFGRPDGVVDAQPIPPAPVAMGPGLPRAGVAAGSLLGRMLATREHDSPVVDFGQYAGWRIADIAAADPRYLRWLSRHSSGHRYRTAIAQVLGPDPDLGRRAALLR